MRLMIAPGVLRTRQDIRILGNCVLVQRHLRASQKNFNSKHECQRKVRYLALKYFHQPMYVYGHTKFVHSSDYEGSLLSDIGCHGLCDLETEWVALMLWRRA
jgi:hypothetical protein